MVYQIIVKGELDQSWSDWLGEVSISSQPGQDGASITRLTLDATDQAVLFGVLDRLRDLNIALVSVTEQPARPS
jgi:hypothetical protein